MRKIFAVAASAALVAALASPLFAQATQTVTGEVVDVACAVKKAPAVRATTTPAAQWHVPRKVCPSAS